CIYYSCFFSIRRRHTSCVIDCSSDVCSSDLFGEPQAAMSFTNSALNGNYAGVAATPASFGVQVFSGEFAADGASPTGNMTGTEEIGRASCRERVVMVEREVPLRTNVMNRVLC